MPAPFNTYFLMILIFLFFPDAAAGIYNLLKKVSKKGHRNRLHPNFGWFPD
jgi:hypothetical protein